MSRSDKVPKAIIFMGTQANGKFTFFQQNFVRDFVYINLDSLHTKTKEAKLLEECLKQRASFAMDNISPTAEGRKRYIQATRESGYRMEGHFFQSLVKDCIQRNLRRSGKVRVPDRAIVYTPNRLEMSAHDEEFDRLYFVYTRNEESKVDEWKNQCFNEREK